MESRSHPARAQLSLDEGGQALLVVGRCLSLGHANGGQTDIPIWGDLGEKVLEFTLGESFHGGARWRARALGEDAGQNARDLDLEDEIPIGAGGALRLTQPCAASAAAVLELCGNLDADGARRVLLVPPGAGGTLRIGSTSDCHLFWQGAAPGSQAQLSVHEDAGALTLHLRCEEGLRSPDGEPGTRWAGPFPPTERVEVLLGEPDSASRPLALCLSPGSPSTIQRGPD